jgi:hypothetical protein
MTQRTADLWEKVLAAQLKLPPYAQPGAGCCREILEKVRAGEFSEKVEKVLRTSARSLLKEMELTRILVEFKGTEH